MSFHTSRGFSFPGLSQHVTSNNSCLIQGAFKEYSTDLALQSNNIVGLMTKLPAYITHNATRQMTMPPQAAGHKQR